MLCSITLAGVLIGFYIVTAIFEAKYLSPLTRVLSICHPDWGWCLAMGAAICWWLTSLLAIGKLRVTPQCVRIRKSRYFASQASLASFRAGPVILGLIAMQWALSVHILLTGQHLYCK